MSDNSPNQPIADADWRRLWFEIAHDDIQWAKGQSWQALQWTTILLAAVATSSKEFSGIPPCVFTACVVVICAVSVFWLIDLHAFAKKGRSVAADIAKTVVGSDQYLKPRTFDPNHVLYLVARIAIVLAASAIVIAEIW